MGALTRAALRFLKATNPGEFGRVYAATKNTVGTGTWAAGEFSINEILDADLATIRGRVRQLVRDLPHAARAMDVLNIYTVGRGLVPQPRVLDTSGKPANRVNQELSDAWERFAEEADAAGRMHFYDLQALAKRSETETGEFLFIKRIDTSPGRFLPLTLQPVDPDALADLGHRATGGNQLIDGVEYNPTTGRPVRYWLAGTNYANPSAVPAADMVHGFQTLRPGQIRGVSPLAPAVLLAHSFRDYLDSEVAAAQLAAKYLAFVTSPDPSGMMDGTGAAADSTYDDSQGNRLTVEELGIATNVYLNQGEDVKIADSNRPGDSFTPFTRFVLQTLAALTGVSYELLSGNYEGLNYSVLRGVRNDLAKGLEVHQTRLIRQLCTPVYREFVRWCALENRVHLPGYWSQPHRFERVAWTGAGQAPVDPLKELRADADAVKALIKSPVQSIRDRGGDPEQVLDEIKWFKEQAAERGLTIEESTAPVKSNPAAVAQHGDDDQKKAQRPPRRLRSVR